MERVIILGGNNTLGQIIARHLLTSGIEVTVFAEGENDLKISHHHYHYVRGDVYNIYSVSQAIANHDAVISVYSSWYLWKMFYLRDALQNIIKSMTEQNVNRFVFFSYGDNDFPSAEGHHPNPFFKKIFGIDYDQKIKNMFESSIRKSPLTFTINSLDRDFLRQARKSMSSGLVKKYYFLIADEIQKQLILNTELNQDVYLKYSNRLELV